jgi:hypothetical protein
MKQEKFTNCLLIVVCILFAAATTLLVLDEKEQAKENKILNIKQK